MAKKKHKQTEEVESHSMGTTSMRFRDTHPIGRKTLKLYALHARDHREKRIYTQHLKVQRRA